MRTLIAVSFLLNLVFWTFVFWGDDQSYIENKNKQGETMAKMTKVEVEIDLFNLPEIQEFLVEQQEFVKAVRDLRKIQKHYYQDRNEFNLGDMRTAERKVDTLLKEFPKEGWKK